MQQLTLPLCFHEPAPQESAQKRPQVRKVVRAAYQLMLDFFGAALTTEKDDPLVSAPIVQRVVKATEAPPIQTSGVSSVFSLAGLVLARGIENSPHHDDMPEMPLCKIERTCDGVRVIRLRHDETEEWAEKERQRRARQKPPKPTPKAKTKSEKLIQMIS
jgi:hypothetical protein